MLESGFQAVDKQFSAFDFGTYVASAFDVVYAKIDPRGSGFQVHISYTEDSNVYTDRF